MADVNPEMFDTLLDELAKVDKLSANVNSVLKSQEQLTSDVEEMKEFVGYEDDSQLKNVIDKKKLPARLTNNERIRYENIGKQFMLGAGKEFDRIRNKIKFGEMMSTTKDKFIKGFEKVKSKVTSVKKGSGLWSKIFKIIALLGILGFIFKDKIAKLLPNTTQFFSNLIDKVQDATGKMLMGLWDFIKEHLSGSFSGILKHLANVVIPNSVGTFFGKTLPDALLQTWLSVMSSFSSSAGEQLSKMAGQSVTDFANETTDLAQQQINEIEKSSKESNAKDFQNQIKELKYIGYLLEEAETQSEVYGMIDDSMVQKMMKDSGKLAIENASSEAYYKLSWAAKTFFGDKSKNLQELIDSGQFDATRFVQLYSDFKKTEDTHVSFVKAFNDALGNRALAKNELDKKVNELKRSYGDNLTNPLDEVVKLHEKYFKQTNEAFVKKQEMQMKKDKELQSQLNIKKAPPVVVSFDKALDSTLTETLKGTFESIKKFLNGEDNLLIKHFSDGVLQLKRFYQEFFEKSLGILQSVVENVDSVTPVEDGKQIQTQYANGSNNIILNVDLSDSMSAGISSAISSLVQTENNVISQIQETNNKLETLNSEVKLINNLHSASQEYVDEKVAKVSNAVNAEVFQKIINDLDNQKIGLRQVSDFLFGNREFANFGGDTHVVLMNCK